MPERVGSEAVDVLLELPGEARLADARDSGDEHELGALLLVGGVEEILDELQLAVAADKRSFEPCRAHHAAPARNDAHRTPQLHGLGLALHLVLTDVLVRDRRLGRALGGVACEHGAGLRCRLDPGSRVDEITRDHPLVRRPERDRSLASEDPGAGAKQRVELGDRRDEVERGPDGPLGIVFLRDRRAPDGHHGVADELFDRAAVALDHRACDVEVAAEELARVLRVTSFGGSGEADEVDEEHRDETALGGCRLLSGRRRSGGTGTSPSLVPHSPQNFTSDAFGLPHEGQSMARFEPHSPQNLRPSSFSAWQDAQITSAPHPSG